MDRFSSIYTLGSPLQWTREFHGTHPPLWLTSMDVSRLLICVTIGGGDDVGEINGKERLDRRPK